MDHFRWFSDWLHVQIEIRKLWTLTEEWQRKVGFKIWKVEFVNNNLEIGNLDANYEEESSIDRIIN